MVIKTGTANNDILLGTDLDDTMSGMEGDDILLGGNDFDVLYGGIGNDSLLGGGSGDTLDGGAGNDLMEGGDGDDVYFVDSAADIVTEKATALGGRDTVITSLSNYTLAANVEELHYSGNVAARLLGNAGNNYIFASALNDTIYGGAGDDRLYGGKGNNLIYGGADNDTFFTSIGADSLAGGTGDDIYFLGNHLETKGDVIFELAGEGCDQIVTGGLGYQSSTGATGEAHYFELGAEIENLVGSGSFAFKFTGNGLNNKITGGSYADTLDGGAGADTLSGGSGNDVYVIDNVGDVIAGEASGNVGKDTARVSGLASWIAAAGIERIEMMGGTASVTGNDEDNTIFGTTLNETQFGGAGNDILHSNGGTDELFGGTGDDSLHGSVDPDSETRMTGGLGDDTYYIHTSTEKVVELGKEGYDVAYVSTDWQMSGGVEGGQVTVSTGVTLKGNSSNNLLISMDGADEMTGGAGNDTLLGDGGNDTLSGANGNDTIDGGSGDDRLIGGAGNDTFHVDSLGDQVVESSDAGQDLVCASVDFTLSATVEHLTLFTGATSGSGNAGANRIIGSAGANILNGMGGADKITGGLGGDTMTGGSGGDTFIFRTLDSFVADGARDIITDFVRGSDKLDVKAVDAIYASGAIDDFVFLGTSAFTNTAGEMRVEAISGGMRVLMDGTGDGVADMAIDVLGANTLTAADFLF